MLPVRGSLLKPSWQLVQASLIGARLSPVLLRYVRAQHNPRWRPRASAWFAGPYLPDLRALTAEVRDATAATNSSFLGRFTDELLLTLSELTGKLKLEVARDEAALPRPDCCARHKRVLLFKGEDGVPNGGHTLYQAEEALGTKMSGRWNKLTMGSLPGIVCYANCGAQLQYHIMMRDTETAAVVSEVFNLRQVCSFQQYLKF